MEFTNMGVQEKLGVDSALRQVYGSSRDFACTKIWHVPWQVSGFHVIPTEGSREIHQRSTIYSTCASGGKPSTWFPPGRLVEQAVLTNVLAHNVIACKMQTNRLYVCWMSLIAGDAYSKIKTDFVHTNVSGMCGQNCLAVTNVLVCNPNVWMTITMH